MVIKVDFDLTMSILAHNLICLFARDLPGYSHSTDFTLFNKFLSMSGSVEIKSDEIELSRLRRDFFDRINKINKIFLFSLYPEHPVYPV